MKRIELCKLHSMEMGLSLGCKVDKTKFKFGNYLLSFKCNTVDGSVNRKVTVSMWIHRVLDDIDMETFTCRSITISFILLLSAQVVCASSTQINFTLIGTI